jgi:hypothetical protein
MAVAMKDVPVSLLTTRQVLYALRRANPRARLTDDRIRSALRRERCPPPTILGGRFLWSPSDIDALAGALGLRAPGGIP